MAPRGVGMRGVVKIDIICRKCDKILDHLNCIIDRNPGKSENGVVRFTSSTVNCCDMKSHVAVNNESVKYDMKHEFDHVNLCSIMIKIYNVSEAPVDHPHVKLGLPVKTFHHEEAYTFSNGVFKQSCLDIPSPVHIKLMMVRFTKLFQNFKFMYDNVIDKFMLFMSFFRCTSRTIIK